MTTHRLIQIHNLEDNVSSKARIARRAADNLARIGNNKGAGHYLRAASRFEQIADKCRLRLGAVL